MTSAFEALSFAKETLEKEIKESNRTNFIKTPKDFVVPSSMGSQFIV